MAEGKAGFFAGAVADQSVIRPYLREGEWSPHLVSLFRDFFAQAHGGTFVDIGANIELVTVPVARAQGVACVVAFEPDPENCRLLRANVAMNDVGDRVRIINAAVGDRPGRMAFTRDPFNSGDHRLSADGDHAVDVVTLDATELPAGRLGVKIDTQAAEPLIFAGGARTLRSAALVVAEFWPWGMARMRCDPQPVLDFVATHRKRGHLLHHDGPVDGAPLSTAALLDAMGELVADGGRLAQADVALVDRPPGCPGAAGGSPPRPSITAPRSWRPRTGPCTRAAASASTGAGR